MYGTGDAAMGINGTGDGPCEPPPCMGMGADVTGTINTGLTDMGGAGKDSICG